MELIWPDLKIPLDQDEANLPHLLARKLKVSPENIQNWRIIRRSVDARKKPEIFFVYTIGFALDIPLSQRRRALSRFPQIKEQQPVAKYPFSAKPDKKLMNRPIVAGTGPAGYFAALALAEQGYRPLILERGDKVEERSRIVERFWRTGRLDTESNVQFGEGGAGTFSDGKLTTRIDDSRIRTVLETFVEYGAAKEILYAAKPHIGTDILKTVVAGLRRKIESLGGEILFRTKVTGLKVSNARVDAVEINQHAFIPAEAIILAVGHSARDVYRFLRDLGIALEAKPLAIGVRIEHPQETINLAQYGVPYHPVLGSADYRLTYKDTQTGRSAYSFCMCPGGLVVASSSEDGGVVTNGMSNLARDGAVANSAVVVTVGTSDFASTDPLAGVDFQRKWEQQAFLAGGKNYHVPAQTVTDFLGRRVSREFALATTYRPGMKPADLHTIMPAEIGEVLARALIAFEQRIKGFAGEEATLTGIESRTSAPVRIQRDDSGQAVNLKGLFPAGEGAGYAGGIMSSAVDGIKAAEKLMAQYAAKE